MEIKKGAVLEFRKRNAFMFEKVQSLYKLKKQTDPLRKVMGKLRVDEESGGIRVVLRGDFTLEEFWLDGERRADIEKVFKKATKKVQKKLAKKMGGRMGELF